MRPEAHISDQELAMAMDGELSEPQAAAVQRHLAQCSGCRDRLTAFEQAASEYLSVYSPSGNDAISLEAGAAARLRHALEEQTRSAGLAPWWREWLWSHGRPVLVAAALVAMLAPAGIFLWYRSGRGAAGGPLPDPRLTPGAVRLTSREQVCEVAPQDEGRLVPQELAQQVFQEYRIGDPKPGAYEVDYLISPALGGTTEIENLWPIPYSEGEWNSRVKDALEDHLRTLVCDGDLDLATAQREMAVNWIAAYRKYFHARKPMAAHVRFVKDSPWE